MIAADYTELVGNTPLVYLNKVTEGCTARIACKVEYMNPSCSVKDRAGMAMIVEAEKRGLITPGKTVLIEATSGNTGISMAAVAAVRGYKVILIQGDNGSLERRAAMRAYGAHVIICDSAIGAQGMIDRAHQLAEKIPEGVVLNQFANELNPLAHYTTTGPEIWKQTEGKVAAVCFGVGTGGTVSGVGKYLKEQNAEIDVFAVEPFESSVINGLPKGQHKIQGMGAGMIPPNLDQSLLAEALRVTSDDAIAMSLRLAREEGLLVGISSGANVCAAIELARRPEYAGKLIVTSLASFGDRYLSSPLYESIKAETDALPNSSLEDNLAQYLPLFQ